MATAKPRIPCKPVMVARSDGATTFTVRNGQAPEPNEPTREQKINTPSADGSVDYYRPVQPDGDKDLDWRRKLGQWLVLSFDSKNEHKDTQFILSRFPENYTLWEHVRVDATGARRTDGYLYGHPDGRSSRFRSPAEFFEHLAWLATPLPKGRCICKICAGKGGETQDDGTGVAVKETKPAHQNQAQTQTQTQMKPTNAMPSAARGVSTTSTRAPTGPSLEQRLDSEPNGKYLYRPGELVWYNKTKDTWGLAVISMRQIKDDSPRYLVQPLSHPFSHPPAHIKDQENDLRPWLAWSVPTLGYSKLQGCTYDQVNWEEVIVNYPADPVVDGSILAAKVIDSSYSLFEQDENALANQGERCYKGIYLGAEKIWVGEPVRLRSLGDDILVLVIKKIIERMTSPTTSNVTFVGDVWKFVKVHTPIKDLDLPARMIHDLNWRNRVEGAAQKGIWNEWRIMEPNARRTLGDVKGRWYETQALLRVLRGPATFENELARGITGDAGLWMNGRGDFNETGDLRQQDRESTFGRAVPAGFRVSRGLDDSAGDRFPDHMDQNTGIYH